MQIDANRCQRDAPARYSLKVQLRALLASEAHIPPKLPAIKREGQCLSGQGYLVQLPDVPVGTPSTRRRFVHL